MRSAYLVRTYCIILLSVRRKRFCKLNLGHVRAESVEVVIAGDEEIFLPYLAQSMQELWQIE